MKVACVFRTKMESLIPEVRDIVESYMSPYHEICRQNKEAQRILKNMLWQVENLIL